MIAPEWLKREPGPKMLIEGLKLIGINEYAGAANNPTIMGWAREVGVDKIYTADSIAWCSLFMAIVAKRAGKSFPMTGYDLLRAKEWTRFGHRPDEAMLGDVLIFNRPGGAHVALYCAESKDSYLVLGGNQSDSVNLIWIAKSRLYSIRRPNYNNQPENIRKIFVTRDGSLSQNEA